MFRKLFLVKEIKSKAGILHFQRWRILTTPWFNIYIHRIFKADEDKYLHNHPWDYTYFILDGSYKETYNEDGTEISQILEPGSYGDNDGYRFHKIEELYSKSVTTLFITGPRYRDWQYNIDGLWIDHKVYREYKNDNFTYKQWANLL